MTPDEPERREGLSFTWYLLAAIILVAVPTIGFIAAMDNWEVENELVTEHLLLQEQTEKSIGQAMHLIDTGRKLFATSLDRRMRQAFGPFLEEYERSGRDPARMDLAAVRERIGGDMDLYIINESGIIEYTTDEQDLGLDFRIYPEYYASLTALRLGDAFSAERMVKEPGSGQVMKYAYMPTPDHRYLFELGTTLPDDSPYSGDLTYTSVISRALDLNPDLLGIRVYCEFGQQAAVERDGAAIHQPPAWPIVAAVLRDGTDVEVVDPENGTLTRYIHINCSDQDYAITVDSVVELTYTTLPLMETLYWTRMHHLLLALAAIILTAAIAFPVAQRITRPVRRIANDVDTIARGDLDHAVGATGGAEFARLERSITAMVASLKDNIRRLEASEKQIQQYSEDLEEKVRERTAELESSNQEANLYLDILIHDINNANAVTVGYAALLAEILEGERREHAEKALRRLQMSREIIDRVATIRKVQDEAAPLRAVDLDSTITMQIAGHPTAAIRYEPRPVTVLADELLPEIFTNLIGNAVRHGGSDTRITITVQEEGNEIVVTVADTGPGVPDRQKESLVTGSRAGEESPARKGLGLYICRMLVERYGGRIWIDDRVPGHPEKGAAFRFTLQKAPESDISSPERGI
ncbi:HAMP domain-containing histidine kinase [Methanoculleus sp. FWC-SCC1]|uniref:histidine kinase n=1 Tax=Methanoculleus frigidifontis TaxID=2584085 RepID=A0ABT8MD73_9EURY|nr:HAMP domain-containing sensor histidine kinase [Methanoculleus sp. FWC-SCC1]MDN7025902.1 HAMP domain-containing histidine kinase [Methanoculleus sp. FWC-SCC1]